MTIASDQPPEIERRTYLRRKANVRAWVDPGGVQPVMDSVVAEMTKACARRLEPEPHRLSDSFHMKLKGTSRSIAAHVIWRTPSIVAVRFRA
jgi:hypothetical protein